MHLEVATSPILDDKGKVTACVHIVRDISERKNMQEKLIMQERLASIGQLASGIAHEINNPLNSILGFSQMILDGELPDEVRADLKIVHSEAQRTAIIVKGLLTFARNHPATKQQVNVNKIIDSVLELRAYKHKVNNIEVIKRFGELPEIMADYFQMQQVFMNVIVNAEYFMIEAHKRGTLTITTERLTDVVRIAIADDGTGIAEEQKKRLFNPFTTTKPVGKGTGLGLSICHGIVTEHSGRVYAESKLGEGATFFIELPFGKADIKNISEGK